MQRKRSKAIHDFILERIETHPLDISAMVTKEFGISRQAACRHMRQLVGNGFIETSKTSHHVKYELKELESKQYDFNVKDPLEEDKVWTAYVKPVITNFTNANAYDILYYGFTEIFNNALDHSEGEIVNVTISIDANNIKLVVKDDGIGIFKKIQGHFDLDDSRHALLELSKGKITSDPERHTGEGIFFASRMFDCFFIWSQYLSYIRHSDDDWLLEYRAIEHIGTYVSMRIRHNTNKTSTEVFEKYASEANDYGFTRTHVPVNLALYEGETLVSRSQAKRLLARVDRFKEVWLDFKDVKSIGPAFADEIFRVFAKAHPNIQLFWSNANPMVEKMIHRAMSNGGVPTITP